MKSNLRQSDLHILFYVENGETKFSDINDGIRGTHGNNVIADDIKKTKKIVRKIDPENYWWKLQIKGMEGKEIKEEERGILTRLDKQFSKIFTKEKATSDFNNSIGRPGESYFLYNILSLIENDEEKLNMLSKASNNIIKEPIFIRTQEMIESKKQTQKGKRYIDFDTVYLMEPNKNTSLSNLLKNNKEFTVIDFWASWCHPCIKSLPSEKELYNKYNQKANFVNVAVMDRDVKKLQKISNEKEISWISHYDQNNLLPDKYVLNAIPTTILLDENGNILLRTHNILEVERFLK